MRIDSGREIALVSNDLDAPAAEIAALYKQRWQIELFFKWIKQNLKIRHFLGPSENAVRIQIVTALIAYLLLLLAQIGTGTGLGLQAIARLVAKTTFQRRASSGRAVSSNPDSGTRESPTPQSRNNDSQDRFIDLLAKEIPPIADADGWVDICVLGVGLRKVRPDFTPSQYGKKKLKALLQSCDGQVEIRTTPGTSLVRMRSREG